MAEFNLIDEGWIPCITLDGESAELGIRDVLLRAHELREICDDSPLVTVGIHRLLLAILYRAFHGPSGMQEWKTLYSAGSFDENDGLVAYLSQWRDRFFLFDDTHPFMQVAGLDLNKYKADGSIKMTKGRNEALDSLMRLVREAPDKKGRILFDHRVGTEHAEYQPPQIARMLLAAQSYAGTGVASGGKVGGQAIAPTPCQFAPCVDGLCLWLEGESLFQTLMLNLVPIEMAASDLPAWEDPGIVNAAIQSWTGPVNFAGPVQRFATLSRFIRVTDRSSMFYTNGLKTSADSSDPMKAYSRPSDTSDFVALKLREDKAAWRDAHSLFPLSSNSRKPPACLNHAARLIADGMLPCLAHPRANVVGLATDQGKSLLWRHERMPVPGALLRDSNLIERLGGLLQEAERAGSVLCDRAKRIARFYRIPDGREPSKIEWDDINKVVEDIDPRPAYWARLEQHFFDLLEHLPNDWDAGEGGWKRPDDRQEATCGWRKAVRREATRALEESIRSLGTTARAIAAVARVRTTFSDEDLKRQAANSVA